jgi:hypothetical protein
VGPSTFLICSLILAFLNLNSGGLAQNAPSGRSQQGGEVTVPSRPAEPPFKGKQGEQCSEVDSRP